MDERENGGKQNKYPQNDIQRLQQMRAQAFGSPGDSRGVSSTDTRQRQRSEDGAVQRRPQQLPLQAEHSRREVRDVRRQSASTGSADTNGRQRYPQSRQGVQSAQNKNSAARENAYSQRAQSTRNTADGAARPAKKSGTVSTNSGIVPGPNTKRNLFLFSLLALLVTVCVIVFGIQSCSKKETDSNSPAVKDKVQLSTPDKGKTDAPTKNNSLFAEYTDSTETLQIDSGYGILIDLSTNKVIAEKGAGDRIYPASMTKIMTLIVAYENIDNLEDTYTFKAEMLDEYYRQNASVAGFSAGESVPVKDLLYGCILPSGADATGALAEYVAGSEEAFAALMNKKAAEMGLKDTHFVTASGLHDDDHYSTCEDMAAILRYAINNEATRQVLATYKYTTSSTAEHPDGIELTGTLKSRMAGDEAEGVFVQGGKTGYTIEGKNCLATFAANCTEENAEFCAPRYILVTAYASGEYTPVFDAIDVYKNYCSP